MVLACELSTLPCALALSSTPRQPYSLLGAPLFCVTWLPRSYLDISGLSRDDDAFAGQTSLHHVCKIAEIGKLSKLLRALKAVGADLRAMDTVDGRGFTPFHVACAGGHSQVLVTEAIPSTAVDVCTLEHSFLRCLLLTGGRSAVPCGLQPFLA